MLPALPPVTIGLPVYNCAPYLHDVIRSIYAQTHDRWEVVAIDDGSTDGSFEILSSLSDPRFKVFRDGQNLGLAARLNQVSLLASHHFVVRQDADDWMVPDRLERQLSVLVNNPEFDLVGCGILSLNQEGELVGVRGSSKVNPTFEEVALGKSGIAHATVMFRREWLLRNPYDPSCRRAQDFELWLGASARNDLRAIVISDPLYAYREELNVKRSKLLQNYRVGRKSIRTHVLCRSLQRRVVLRSYLKSARVLFIPDRILWAMSIRSRNGSQLSEELVRSFKRNLQVVRDIDLSRIGLKDH